MGGDCRCAALPGEYLVTLDGSGGGGDGERERPPSSPDDSDDEGEPLSEEEEAARHPTRLFRMLVLSAARAATTGKPNLR